MNSMKHTQHINPCFQVNNIRNWEGDIMKVKKNKIINFKSGEMRNG